MFYLSKISVFLFNILGLTAFCLPPFLILTLFLKNEKVKKYLKLALILWIPVLINLALDLLILYLLGVNLPGFFRRLVDEVKSLFGDKK